MVIDCTEPSPISTDSPMSCCAGPMDGLSYSDGSVCIRCAETGMFERRIYY